MKTLQTFREMEIPSSELMYLKGGFADAGNTTGTPVSGSVTVMGSVISYSGTIELTADVTTTVGPLSGTSYVSDFCGQVTADGMSSPGCAQYYNGAWHLT